MGVTAALAGMLLIAVPAGAASAVDDAPAGDVPAVQAEEVAPAAPVPHVASDAQAAEAQVPAAAQGTATLRGTVKFPPKMVPADRGKFNVTLRRDNATPPTDHTKANGNLSLDTVTGAWSISGLDATVYDWALFSLPGVQFNLKVLEKLDLRSGQMANVVIDAYVGEMSGTIVQDRSDVGVTGVFFKNTATNAVVDATKDAQSGGQGPDESRSTRLTPVTPGNYIMYVKLLNGRTVYYTGSAKGSLKSADARTIAVTLHNSTHLANMDVREFIKIFTDVPAAQKFYTDISWMESEGITTGVKQANGSVKYLPKGSVSREAMIAFLYRLESPTNYQAPSKSPFTDVKPGHKFYKQIMWAYENKITTGIALPNDRRKFAPSDRISREAMAAFMYRQYKNEIPTQSGATMFVDVPEGHKFYGEITWMSSNGITTGVKQSNGTLAFAPKDRTSREATAAFLHRAEMKK